MDLRKRLASLDRYQKKNGTVSDETQDRPLPDHDDGLHSLGLKFGAGPGGSIWTKSYEDGLPDFPEVFSSLVGFFTHGSEATPALEELLFLDTETTGLAGGTGTIAFLVGIGWIREGRFHSRQYFMPDFTHEAAMLEELAGFAADFEVVVTYNGASFDLPLLRTRALMNRLADPCGNLVSWDLLVPCRRLWGKCFPNCRQQTLENHLLGLQRNSQDIAGSLIPQTWFEFLKTGQPGLLPNVLHHNQKDLLGMLGLFARILDMATRLRDNGPRNDFQVGSWLEAWALGKIAEKAGERALAAQWMLRSATEYPSDSEVMLVDERFVGDAIRLLKRQKAWVEIRGLISEALLAGVDEHWLHREAAILFEHRLHELELALVHAQECSEPRRVQRLQRKIAKGKGIHEQS